MLNLFVIHWNEEELYEYINPFLSQGWNVGYEYKNELHAKETIEKLEPDIILIFLSITPSRGIISAKIIKKTDSIRHIPIIFIDGKPKNLKKFIDEHPNVIHTTSENLIPTLLELEE
jgi:two-component SAPR family response regulator